MGDDIEGDIIKKSSRSTRTVWIIKSNDDGLTWSVPENITAATKKKEWRWYATGPGIGIQIKNGPHKGRLVIPCDFSNDDSSTISAADHSTIGSHSIYSDDHGASWKLGGTITPKMNECQVIEVADGNGTLLMNMRSYFQRLLVQCLQEIATGAPSLPLYYYNIPALTGISLDMVKLLEKAGQAIPSFAGIKYTAPLIHDYQACVNFDHNKYDILYGTDEMLLGRVGNRCQRIHWKYL